MITDCTGCGATGNGCEVKRWLSGRACCEQCEHPGGGRPSKGATPSSDPRASTGLSPSGPCHVTVPLSRNVATLSGEGCRDCSEGPGRWSPSAPPRPPSGWCRDVTASLSLTPDASPSQSVRFPTFLKGTVDD